MSVHFRLLRVCAVLGMLATLYPVVLTANEEEFVIAIGDAELEFHPHRSFTVTEAQIFTAIYEGLVSYNPLTLAPEAAVAERWEVSDDGRKYTFYLREDAVYWNGEQVTAQHFRDAWLALLAPESDSYFSVLFDVISGASDYRNGISDDPTTVGVVAQDTRTLEVTLVAPTPFFLSTLCHYSFSPVHPRMLRVKNWNDFPLLITNGPYVLRRSNRERLRLTQSENYWDYDKDNFQRIKYILVDSEDNVFDKFVKREVDWVITGFGEDITRYNNALKVNPILGTSFYFFVADEVPWSDPQVRRALALALPWQEVRSAEHYNFPTPALVPPIPDYEQQTGITEQDIDEARSLLKESGYAQGSELPPLTIAIPDTDEDKRIAELMVTAWAKLGVTAAISAIPGERYFDYVEEADDYTLGRISWIGDYLDPLAFLQLWSSDSNLNHAQYSDAAYDTLLQRAAEREGVARAELLQDAEKIIIDGALLLPINHSVAVNAIDTEHIRGWYVNVLDIHPVKSIVRRQILFLPGVALATQRNSLIR